MMYRRGFLALLLILLLGPLTACRDTGGTGSSGTEGSMRVVTGTCKVTFKTETKVVSAGQKAPVPMGALLETDDTGVAVVNWGKTSQILQKSSKLTFVAESKIPGYGVGKVELLRGLASFLLPKSESPDFKFQASSHSIVAAVKGTAFDMSAEDDGAVTVQVTSGTVSVFKQAPGEKATADKPEDAGELLATAEKGDVYSTADYPIDAAPDLGGVLATGPTGGPGRSTTLTGDGGTGSAPDARPGATPTRPSKGTPPKLPLTALFKGPLKTGLNKGAIAPGSITAWEITSKFLLDNAIMNF